MCIRDRYRKGETVMEETPVGESSGNGRAEDAGKRVREQAKVIKDQIEWKTKEPIGADEDILKWLVRWAAMVKTRYARRWTGKTPWEHIRGSQNDMEVVPFGESVFYRKLKPKGEAPDKLDSQWEEGIWLGHMDRSPEAVIGTREGCVKAWAIRRKPEGNRWDAAEIRQMRGTPEEPSQEKGGNRFPRKSI